MLTIVPYHRGGGRCARSARGRWRCRGRPGADLRAACGEMSACPRGTRSYDGVRVACVPDRGRSLARGRVSNVSVRADPIPPGSGRRASRRGGAWPPCPPRAFPLAFHRYPVSVPGVASRHEKGRHRVPVAASRPATLANARSTPSCPRDVRSRRSRAPRHTRRHPSSGTPYRCARCGAQSRPAGR